MDIGIDLGTTFSVLAVDGKVDLTPDYPGGAGHYLENCDVTIIPSPVGEPTFPSVMIPDPENPSAWLFGAEAVQKADEGFAPVMFSKRKIGTTERIPVAGGEVTAKQVAARFLKYLKQCAEHALGQPVDRAVVTHPAYFDRGAVEETREAAREAGFDMSLPQQMLMEPVAAALAYTRADVRDPLRVLTYDLGGGTFDVTCLERRGGVISMQSFDGNHLLGGYNFDLALVHLVLARLKKNGRVIRLDENNPEDRGRLARLLRLAEEVKIKLSRTTAVGDAVEFRAQNALVDDKGRMVQFNERFTRREFTEAIQDYLNEVLLCCRRALEKAKVKPDELHEILLVGGSSRGPWVMDNLKAAFPKVTPRLFEPDLCVGAGAAIHARMALPRNLASGRDDVAAEFKVTLDVPEATLLEQIHIAGRVVPARDDQTSVQGVLAELSCASGSAPAPMPLAASGGFLFKDVELVDNSENKFVLRLRDAAKKILYEKNFAIHQGTTTGVATTMTVLPRPLYIETSRGLVALAEEGAALPAKITAEFERANAKTSMEIRLFQEQDPVGLVHINNIPATAGAGSPVLLTLAITADNHVQGDVAIFALTRDRSGNVTGRHEVLRGEIDVSFDPTAIPSREELEQHLQGASEQFAWLKGQEPDFAMEIESGAEALMGKIKQLFAQPVVERQEIHVALRRFRNLLALPKDQMSPPRLHFKRDIRKCRERIAELVLSANELLADTAQASGGDRAKEKLRAEKSLKRLPELESRIALVERDGLDAHAQKNQAVWENKCALLNKLETQVEETRKFLWPDDDFEKRSRELLEQAPFLLKVLVLEHEIKPLQQVLATNAANLQRKGSLEIWRRELDEIHHQLEGAARSVLELDDKMDSQQLRAQIQVILRTLPDLKKRINRLGHDVA